MRGKSWMLIAAGAVMLAATFILTPVRNVAAAGRWGPGYFPNFELTTQDGQKVHFYDDLLKGKVVVIYLMYTHCVDSCPLETARLVEVQRMLGAHMGKDIFIYGISIDPKRDTPEVLKAYAAKYHVGPGWLFLTGKPDEIDVLSKKLGLYSDPDPGSRDGHLPGLMVGNEPANQWMLNAATDNPRYLAMTIENLVARWKDHEGKKPEKTYAEAPSLGKVDKGQYLFKTRCSACHTIGHGVRVGPDLLGVTNVRERGWLSRFIQRPEAVLDDKDPIAVALFKEYKGVQMPNLRLGPGDVETLIDYMAKQDKAADHQETVAAKPPEKTTEKEPQ